MVRPTSGPDSTLTRARPPLLTLDDTTAHITAAAEQVRELLDWFRGASIACVLRPQAGAGGLDVIDFGDPGPAQERAIRRAFAEWRRRAGD
jgi:hypothetical protein